MRIGKKQLAEELSKELSVSQKEAERILQTFQETIMRALFRGDTVVLSGLFSLSVVSAAPRTYFDPRTRERKTAAAKKMVKCRISSALQKSLIKNFVPSVVIGWVSNPQDLQTLQEGFEQIQCRSSVKPVLTAQDVADVDVAIVGPACANEDADMLVEELAESKQNILVVRFMKQNPERSNKHYRYLPWMTVQMPSGQEEVKDLFETKIRPEVWSSGSHTFRCKVATWSERENVTRLRKYLSSFLPDVIEEKYVKGVLKGILEALDNAIQHGNKDQPDKQVELAVLVAKDRLIVEVTDEGEGFDHSDHLAMLKTKRSEEVVMERKGKRPGGLGIPLMKKVFDAVTFTEAGNTVRMEKLFGQPQKEAESPEAPTKDRDKEEWQAVEEVPSPSSNVVESVEEVEMTDSFTVEPNKTKDNKK